MPEPPGDVAEKYYKEIRRNAEEALEHPERLDPAWPGRVSLQLVHHVHPSFDDWIVYTVANDSGSNRYLLRRALWHRGDVERQIEGKMAYFPEMVPPPTMSIHDAVISLGEWEGWMGQASCLRPPMILGKSSIIGLDGTSYILKTYGHFGGQTFNWWSVPPPGWEPLHEFAGRLREWFDKKVERGN